MPRDVVENALTFYDLAQQKPTAPRRRMPRAERLILEVIDSVTEPGEPLRLTDREISEEIGLSEKSVNLAVQCLNDDQKIEVTGRGHIGRFVCITAKGQEELA